jgi:arylformamidase
MRISSSSRLLWVLIVFPLSLCGQKKDKNSYIKVSNITYASLPKTNAALNAMDIYMPKKGSNSPVVLWIHGGAWSTGDKEEVHYKAEYFTSKGYVFISINYRLSPQVQHPVHVQDVANAIVWLHNNAKHYSANASRIFLMGHSAGAHIAALVTLDERYLKTAGGMPEIIQGVVLLEGAGYDIPSLMERSDKRLQSWYIQAFGNSAWGWSQASPTNFVSSSQYIPPMFIAHAGDRDLSAFEAKKLYERLNESNAPCKLVSYPKKSHATLVRDIGVEKDKPTEDITRFLQEKLYVLK